jgi:hypothetical protein
MFCKSCEPEIVFVLICTLAEKFHVHKSYKMRESTLSCIGNFKENIDLSLIHLTVLFGPRVHKSSLLKQCTPLPFPSNAVDVECKLDGPGQRLSMALMQAAQMCLSQHNLAALALQQ